MGGAAGLVLSKHPIARAALVRLRDATTPPAEFRSLVSRIAAVLVVEASAGWALEEVSVRTPLESAAGHRLAAPVTLVAILRAGLGMLEGALSVLPEARVGHLGIRRDEASLRPIPYYRRLPSDLGAGPVLLLDPMLATGGTAAHAVDLLREEGARDLTLLCLLAAPEGVSRLAARHPDLPIRSAALDRGLDERGYIRPGLGDAGDRIFDTA